MGEYNYNLNPEVDVESNFKELSEYTDEELQELLKQTQDETYLTENINQAMTPTEQIKDVQRRLSQINNEINRRAESKE